ncbi:MAG TPA: hypothetical protein VNW90_06725 [Acetobacteraceae bacterium]|jgi:hypothetical protein|nr:hypothetical protein [Acetobacteraceae bacterium]
MHDAGRGERQPGWLVALKRWLPVFGFIVLVLLAYRMTIGVDLSDESYYVTFLDGWLKDGLGHSENLEMHQSAALLVLPAARLYTWIVGSERGLVLFLRVVFLAIAFAASLCQYRFIRCMRDEAVALSSALLVLCFIPFSLPAPSYNTIGMFGVVSALALFGTAALPRRQAAHGAVTAILSGLAWMVAVIAYPTMAVALLALLALASLAARDRGERLRLLGYAMICAFFQFCGACLLLAVFGWTRLVQMLRFTSAGMQSSESVNPKLADALGVFVNHPAFGALCLAAVAVGIWLVVPGRDRRRNVRPSLLVLAIVLASYATGPALWFPPNDFVVLLALAGLFTMRACAGTEGLPVIRVIYATSLVGGLITAATSDNGIHNFPIGGLAAAALAPAMLVPRGAPRSTVAAQCGMMLLTAALFCTSAFASIYGESANPLTARAVRVKDGAFAGLLTNADQAAFIEAATAALGERVGRGKTIAVLGRPAGIYLLTDASPMAPSAWDYWQFYGSLPPRMNALMEAFYKLPAHRPDVVAVFTDPRTYPLAPWVRDLLTDYVAAARVSVGSWSLALYEHCKAPACPARTTHGVP